MIGVVQAQASSINHSTAGFYVLIDIQLLRTLLVSTVLLVLFSVQSDEVTVAQDGWTCTGGYLPGPGVCWLTAEHDTLMEFYNSTNGSGWDINGFWGTAYNICVWSFITCDGIISGPIPEKHIIR